jgi:hypothetical protein
MTTIAIPYPSQARSHSRFSPLVIIAVALILMGIVYSVHAYQAHGEIADQVRQCLEKNGPVLQVQNPLTGRIARACPLGRHFGIQILEKDGEHEVTSFPNKSHTIEQLIQYLRNAGYFIK